MQEKITVLFITFNRSELLIKTFEAMFLWEGFLGSIKICSDDGSTSKHLARIKNLPFDKVISTERNGGLGKNNNKGLLACSTEYILMIQDDCILINPECIDAAIKILNDDPAVGIVRFTLDPRLPSLLSKQIGDMHYWICDHLSEEYKNNTNKLPRVRVYSDQPHLRRRSVHEKYVGMYAEGLCMEDTEMNYEDRFDAQANCFVAFLSNKELINFSHCGAKKSFRTRKFRYRLESFLTGIVNFLGLKKYRIYTNAREIYREIQRRLIKFGIFK